MKKIPSCLCLSSLDSHTAEQHDQHRRRRIRLYRRICFRVARVCALWYIQLELIPISTPSALLDDSVRHSCVVQSVAANHSSCFGVLLRAAGVQPVAWRAYEQLQHGTHLLQRLHALDKLLLELFVGLARLLPVNLPIAVAVDVRHAL